MKLSDFEKFNLIKPLPEGFPKNDKGIPFLEKDIFLENIDWDRVNFSSYSNINSIKNKNTTVLLMFQYDKTIKTIYNNIFSFINKGRDFLAIATPDYSAYLNMEPCIIEQNVQHSLWVGAWLKYVGIHVIPTITWADERTYDICFNNIEKGSVVAISTVGVSKNKFTFLKGYKEMMKRINPNLVIIKGNYIKGIYGNLIFVDFKETFNIINKFDQLKLFDLSRIQTIQKEDY